MIDLPAQLEALLFALGRPLTRVELEQMLGAGAEEVEAAIRVLSGRERGIALVDDGRAVELRTAPGAEELVARVRREEYAQGIGKAGLEVLAAVLYRGPLTRSEIDFIRGVNSSQTLRTLTTRGLLRRTQNPKDERSFLYEPTTDLLSQFGLRSVRELPDWDAVRGKLTELESLYRASAQAESQKI